jgi:hypothetical protein
MKQIVCTVVIVTVYIFGLGLRADAEKCAHGQSIRDTGCACAAGFRVSEGFRCDRGRCATDWADCFVCTAGTYSAAGDAACVPCVAGSYASAGDASCTYCEDGSFSYAGASSCTVFDDSNADMQDMGY